MRNVVTVGTPTVATASTACAASTEPATVSTAPIVANAFTVDGDDSDDANSVGSGTVTDTVTVPGEGELLV